jgi:hypothetical protein
LEDTKMAIKKLEPVANLFLAAILSLSAFGSSTSADAPVPGSLNYVEGQVSMGTKALDSKSIGSAELQTGQTLTTEQGKAEVLLTPGVFLRVGKNSSVKMISSSITDTEVAVGKGHAMIEVAEVHPENDLRINEDGATIRLLKTGLYDFDLRQNQLRVFDGKAVVEDGGRSVTVKSGRELNLAADSSLKRLKFDKKSYEEGDLYRWSSLRSAYLAEANVDAASSYSSAGWGPWGWTGWDWDPWFDAYTFIPGDGIWYSPFGWGFYSPWWVFDAPFFGYGLGYGYGYGGGRYFHHFGNYRDWESHSPYVASNSYAHGIYRGPGSVGRGFHSGPRMAGVRSFGGFGHGGFHSGGGGFHGGGGGGFHGGGGGGHGGGR